MAKAPSGKKQHRSMRGKIIDIDVLRKRNELTPAVGNARVNARGDELGPGGKIARRREDIVKEHYKSAGSAQSDTSATTRTKEAAPNKAVEEQSNKAVEEQASPASTKETKKTAARTKKQEPAKIEEQLTSAEKEMLEEDDWTEDENGNFVKKDT